MGRKAHTPRVGDRCDVPLTDTDLASGVPVADLTDQVSVSDGACDGMVGSFGAGTVDLQFTYKALKSTNHVFTADLVGAVLAIVSDCVDLDNTGLGASDTGELIVELTATVTDTIWVELPVDATSLSVDAAVHGDTCEAVIPVSGSITLLIRDDPRPKRLQHARGYMR